MSYLELARKTLENCSRLKPADAPNAMRRCEKSEKSEKSPPATCGIDDEAFICRGIERDLGLPSGSLILWQPSRGTP
jgi:hypothetical protein